MSHQMNLSMQKGLQSINFFLIYSNLFYRKHISQNIFTTFRKRYIYMGVNDIDYQKNMGDTSQSIYQKSLIQFCFISHFNCYVLKPDVFSTGTVRMFTIHQLCGSLQLGNTRVKKKEQQVCRLRSLTFTS